MSLEERSLMIPNNWQVTQLADFQTIYVLEMNVWDISLVILESSSYLWMDYL